MANPVGRPPKYKTAEELQAKIDEYFSGNYRKIKRLVGNKRDGYKEIEVPKITITDLVLYLGFCDRRSFYDLEKHSKFSYTIKKARTFIEREYEEQLDLNPAGAIFALKNFGWSDRLDINGNFRNTNIDMTPEEEKEIKESLGLLGSSN